MKNKKKTSYKRHTKQEPTFVVPWRKDTNIGQKFRPLQTYVNVHIAPPQNKIIHSNEDAEIVQQQNVKFQKNTFVQKTKLASKNLINQTDIIDKKLNGGSRPTFTAAPTKYSHGGGDTILLNSVRQAPTATTIAKTLKPNLSSHYNDNLIDLRLPVKKTGLKPGYASLVTAPDKNSHTTEQVHKMPLTTIQTSYVKSGIGFAPKHYPLRRQTDEDIHKNVTNKPSARRHAVNQLTQFPEKTIETEIPVGNANTTPHKHLQNDLEHILFSDMITDTDVEMN